jgi:hypothetical protein
MCALISTINHPTASVRNHVTTAIDATPSVYSTPNQRQGDIEFPPHLDIQ